MNVLVLFHNRERMESDMASIISPETIAELLDQAPIWALNAMTVANETVRESGRREVAQHIYDALYQPMNTDTAQLPLPL